MTANAILFAQDDGGLPAGMSGNALDRTGHLRRRPPPRNISALWLLLALGALLYAGYYFYFREAPAPAPTVATLPGYADEFDALIVQALAPLGDSAAAADLQSALRGLEQRLAAEPANPALAQNGRNLCWQLRELVKIRGQCEVAIDSINAGRFEGLGGTRVNRSNAGQKDFALKEQARIWQGKAEQARPALAAGLARVRQLENR